MECRWDRMRGGVHAATQTNTYTLKNDLGQGASAHYGPNNASLALLCSSDDRYQQSIIDTRASTRK